MFVLKNWVKLTNEKKNMCVTNFTDISNHE